MSDEPSVDVAFEDGLVPVIAQSVEDDEILMLAYANDEALELTEETGEAHYFSRSRDEIWHKGATSGHRQTIEEIRVDCDGDALIYRVRQTGGACHTGYRSCFYRTLSGETIDDPIFDPDDVYE